MDRWGIPAVSSILRLPYSSNRFYSISMGPQCTCRKTALDEGVSNSDRLARIRRLNLFVLFDQCARSYSTERINSLLRGRYAIPFAIKNAAPAARLPTKAVSNALRTGRAVVNRPLMYPNTNSAAKV